MNRVKSIYIVTRTVSLYRGQKQDFMDTWSRAIYSRLQRQPGFITAWLTTGTDNEEIVITSQWDSEAHYKTWRNSETAVRVRSHIGRYIRAHISEDAYQISATVRGAPPAASE